MRSLPLFSPSDMAGQWQNDAAVNVRMCFLLNLGLLAVWLALKSVTPPVRFSRCTTLLRENSRASAALFSLTTGSSTSNQPTQASSHTHTIWNIHNYGAIAGESTNAL